MPRRSAKARARMAYLKKSATVNTGEIVDVSKETIPTITCKAGNPDGKDMIDLHSEDHHIETDTGNNQNVLNGSNTNSDEGMKITKKDNLNIIDLCATNSEDGIEATKIDNSNVIIISDNETEEPIRITYIKQISGHFHQGDVQFSYQSRGVQCSCNSLAMLCYVSDLITEITPNHLDTILRYGDQLYKVTSHKLQALGQLHTDRYLEYDQLPTSCTLGDSSYKVRYEDLRYAKLDKGTNSAFESLDVELEEAFTVSNSHILIMGSYMIAIYKDSASGYFIFFDSHSRDKFGFPTPDGTSVALLFENIENLYMYLFILGCRLNLNPRAVAIQPVSIKSNTQTSASKMNVNLNPVDKIEQDMKNNPGCSTWSNDNHLVSTNEIPCIPESDHNLQNENTLRHQKWFEKLTTTRQNEIRERKRKTEQERYKSLDYVKNKRQQARQQSRISYTNPEKAEIKRQQAKALYEIPEKTERKRQQAKDLYEIPEKAQRKRQQAKDLYEIPEKAQRKRQQAKDLYEIPEKAQRKRQQAKDLYEIPEKAQRKRHQAKDLYEIPEKAQRKRQQAKDLYEIPEKAQRKRQQAKDLYEIPEKAQRKRQQAQHQSKHSYKDPVKKADKIQQVKSNRSKRNSVIDTVIVKFQKSCKEDQQLIYTCLICQRIFFKQQVRAFYQDTYNQRILLKCLPSDINIQDLPRKEEKDKEVRWICKTCHPNMLSSCVPKLALVNKLSLQKIPPELSQLNMLERHLIAPAIPFMKMISLIKGAQKGITGQVVCVKADIDNTAQSLPRLPTDQSLIKVKLKRKLEYKGHHMCQAVNPTNVRQALIWLKPNNPEYEDIDINFDDFDAMLDDQLIQNNQHQQDNDCPRASEILSMNGDNSTMDTNDSDDNVTKNYDDYDHDYDYDDNENNGNNGDDNTHEDIADTDDIDRNSDSYRDYDLNIDDPNLTDSDDNDDNNDSDASNEHNESDDITNTSVPLYSFLHPVDFAQYLADKHDESIMCIAPGEGRRPENVIDMEAKCFPVEFPDGANTYNEKRKAKLSPSRYFNTRIFSAENRFARNPEYIFFALYATEVHQIKSNISIALRIGSTKTIGGQEITASMLRDHEEVKNLIKRDQGYRFLAHIRGSPAYWEKSKKDLFAMIRQLGIPTFFVTFSAADRRWIEISNAILILEGKPPMTAEQHKNMTWDDHVNIIMSNPAAAAKMFQQRVHIFIKNVIRSKANPIGKVEDFYYRTEFQQRGWPHVHMVVWVKDAPQFDKDSDAKVTEFVDKYISCELPPESDTELHEIVTSVQVHTKNHTKSCRKTGKVCRFNFPKPPSNATFICRPVSPIEESEDPDNEALLLERIDQEIQAKDTLKKVWELIEANNEGEDFEQILHDAGTTQSEFEDMLARSTNRNTMYLKRRIQDQWINNYNPHLIRCWNGNMDIQYVLDPYACVMYMLSYITKAEREMGDLLRNAQREAREGNLDAVSELKKLGSVYLQNREISVMGAIYLVCSMPLRNSTRNVIFLQTDLEGQKISLPLQQLQANAGKSDQVWMTSQIEKYIGRPNTPKYNDMCMATFFSTHYQVSGTSKNTNLNADSDEGSGDGETDIETNNIDDRYQVSSNSNDTNFNVDSDEESGDEETDNEMDHEDPDEESDEDEIDTETDNEDDQSDEKSANKSKCHKQKNAKNAPIELKNCSVKMKERSKGKPAVIRYPRVSAKKDSERYHMNMLRLYLPHRNKHIKPKTYKTYKDYQLRGQAKINGKKVKVDDIVKQNMKEFEPETEELDEAWRTLENAADLEDAWAAINPQGEQQRIDDKQNRVMYEDSDDDFAEIQIPELQSRPNQPRCAIETCKPELTEEQAESMMRQLNDKQRQVFNHVTKWCNDKTKDHNIPPFHIFVTGGAGTGKSHVIKCITYFAQKTFATMTESADDITVQLVAHLGTAAFNISGQTICTALKIAPKSPNEYTPLGENSLNTLRVKYQHLQLLIIDEISMVSTTQLSYIHGRLQQIKGTGGSSYFGNVSILAVGDFYQLPPISTKPLCFPHKEILKDLWNPLFQIVELTEIMRQRDDAIFAQMLNRLRVRKRTEPLEKADKKLLESRIVKDNALEAPQDALHLFFLNDDVDNHNEKKLQTLTTDTFMIKAVDVDQIGSRIIKVNETPHKTSRQNDTVLAPVLKLAVGARTMLISNVDVLDGLCNGVSGVIKGIEFGNSQNMPNVVFVKFDSDRIGANKRTSQFIPSHYAGCTPITPRKETFTLKGNQFSTTREQLPLKLAWAVTIHKVQGQTTEQAVISMTGLKRAMAYVALSRVTHLEGIYLTNYNQSRIFCNENIEANLAMMPTCDISRANPLIDIDHNKHFIIAHHNIQSLHRHIEDLKKNTEITKAHVICLSETWLANDTNNDDSIMIEGYSLESVNSGNGRGVAIYIHNSVNYTVIPLPSNECDVLAVRTQGNANLLIAAIYKPMATNTRVFSTEMNNMTAQIEMLKTDYTVITGDFNRNLLKERILPAFRQYDQVISESTTAKGTLLDHIYVKPKPHDYQASVLTTYYSYHNPVFIAIKS
ncbi:uncharacterized protein [Amphiura filiformis]|uniref:uncharacterized protein n=1 Tax=Amphiura filiformis TaxID=82378 RepID=UPI003B20C466